MGWKNLRGTSYEDRKRIDLLQDHVQLMVLLLPVYYRRLISPTLIITYFSITIIMKLYLRNGDFHKCLLSSDSREMDNSLHPRASLWTLEALEE
jgi:hypothetical protein